MCKLTTLTERKARLELMIDFLNELASGTVADQSEANLDVLSELERLRSNLSSLQGEIVAERKRMRLEIQSAGK